MADMLSAAGTPARSEPLQPGAGRGAQRQERRSPRAWRLPGSVVCDPAHVGHGILRMPPRSLRSFWQDIPAWSRCELELLRVTLAGHSGPVIVPMTLVNPGHFEEIIGSLRDDGVRPHRFALLAEPATVISRLRARSLGPGAENPALGGRSPRRVAGAASPA